MYIRQRPGSLFRYRLILLVALLLVAYGVRLYHLGVADLNIDEAWSFVYARMLVTGEYAPVEILGAEPNNALHLIFSSLNIRLLPGHMGIRWLSVFAGLLSVAAVTRIAYRAGGKRAVFPAALMATVAYGPVYYSQIGRPYAMTTCLALLSILCWMEYRWRLNMWFSALVPLAHVGTMPAVVAQDMVLLWRRVRHQRRILFYWFINRIVVYAAFGTILWLVYLRRLVGKVMSAGQQPPSIEGIVAHALRLLQGNTLLADAQPLLQDVIFILLFLLPVILLFVAQVARRKVNDKTGAVVVGVVLAYVGLTVMAVFSDGPIKFNHLSYVADLLIILFAVTVAQTRAILRWALTAVFVVTSGLSVLHYYATPYRFYTEAEQQLNAARNGEILYTQHGSAGDAIQVNVPNVDYIRFLPPGTEPDVDYLLFGYSNFYPPLPEECDVTPIMTFNGFHLHECSGRGSDSSG